MNGVTADKKIKRNHRIVYISQYLIEHPNELVSLSYFVDYFDCAKSSISEDLDFVREVFEHNELGVIQTISGVSGGVIYYPQVPLAQQNQLFEEIAHKLKQGKRILPGNYIYVSDVLQEAKLLNGIAKLIATRYQGKGIDAVMTIETKGIGLSVAVARYLNVPYVVVRGDSSEAEGSTISINYISGSLQTVKKMALSKLSLAPQSNVLIVDDFLRNGGTVNGLLSMIEEFDCKPAGICVLAQNADQEKQTLPDYVALLDAQIAYNKETGNFELQVKKGNFFDAM
ncbi:pur operon repressor [Aerococcaceae bacterium NML190938]|nr:pur operon repressor [Aerococcaceae bacterium NML191219]MCW6666488.1 pur operon repressor [Aerococcaceae bacterium NML190938]MCW6679964.1 pur operon repressor [Aerococcaceae bacterium NML130460]MDO4774430.1 pur operon repressor [Aerococcaceae bacterium]